MPTKPNFWSQPGFPPEPKRKFQWIVAFGIDDSNSRNPYSIPAYVVKNVTRPSYEISKGEHAYINHTYKYPGRVTWNDITITMVDPIDLDLTGRISEMIRQSGYIIPSRHYEDSQGVPHGRTISKTRATDILLNFELILMDPDENPVERWRLYHPWISNVDNGDLDYTSEDLVDTTLTITYDWASPETVIVENGIIVGDSKIVWNPNADAFSR